MGAKFCFFTDPAKLAVQSAAQAFGPAAAAAGKDRFRVTDVHQIASGTTTPVRAHAISKGQVCVVVAGGHLNLVLRPLIQPPFDFPYVEYFLYRGIRTDSLVDLYSMVDLGKEGAGATLNHLIAYIREKILRHSTPQASTQSPAYLGLDRRHSSTETHGGVWGDGQPLDHLFRYAGGAELPIVEAGWVLGEFGPEPGLEVVVQHYGAQPEIGWARSADPWIEANPMATGPTAAAVQASRLEREAIGCFVDPCAFWGMFWKEGLELPGIGTKKTNHLHAELFTASPGIFANRDRVYLDIRNEVGLSYDFYGKYQDSIQTGPSKSALTQGVYSSSGWPIHHVDAAPSALCFRLCRDNISHPMLFARQTGRPVSGFPFVDLLDQALPHWTSAVTFKRPRKGGVQPPWWFVAHYLRADVGTAGAVPASGAFDILPLEFGPIGDRVIAAFRQMWPQDSNSSSQTAGSTGYERQFVSDKVLRYDGTEKWDPANPARSVRYSRIGETHYVFQKGLGANQGSDSVIIAQRRAFEHHKSFDMEWYQTTPFTPGASAGSSLIFGALTGRMLSAPVTVPVFSATATSFAELLPEPWTWRKMELFDYTILLLSRAGFEAALGALLPSGPPPGPGKAHPVFLSLALHDGPTLAGFAYQLTSKSWNGQPMAGAVAETLVSADGIFFSSTNFDPGALAPGAPALTDEEKDGSPLWDGVLALDTQGSTASDRMTDVASTFITAVAAVPLDPNAPTSLLALVEQYGAAIWNRAVTLAGDPNFESWSDRILYYARLKMGAALKSHPALLADAVTASSLADRFEALSRNYAGLRFTGSTPGQERVIVTGFDPFAPPGSPDVKPPNPSGRLALYLAANPSWTKSNKAFFTSTCIFPVRWSDFDRQVVEKTLTAALVAAQMDPKSVSLVCTVSLDGNITDYVETYANSILYCKIDGFAARSRGNQPDNSGIRSSILSPGTLPLSTSKNLFLETTLSSKDLIDYDNQFMKVRYDWRFAAKNGAQTVRHPPLGPDLSNYDAISGQKTWAPPLDPTTASITSAVYGSGGSYLSNEIYYRSTNLIRSKFSSVKNGHIHVPRLQSYTKTDATTFTVTVEHLADAVLAVIGGEL